MSIRHALPADVDTLADIEAASYPSAEGASRQSIAGRVAVYPDCFWPVSYTHLAHAVVFLTVAAVQDLDGYLVAVLCAALAVAGQRHGDGRAVDVYKRQSLSSSVPGLT